MPAHPAPNDEFAEIKDLDYLVPISMESTCKEPF